MRERGHHADRRQDSVLRHGDDIAPASRCKRGHPERGVSGSLSAPLGLRVRRAGHHIEAAVEYATANRDLEALVAAGFLEARGETRGRFYVGTPELRRHYAEVRPAHRNRINDPYTTLRPMPSGAVLTEPEGGTLI